MSSVCWCGICDRQLSNQSHFTRQYTQIRSPRRMWITGVIFWIHELRGGCPGTSKITSPGGSRLQGSKSSDREIISPDEYAACFQIDVLGPIGGYGYCDLPSKSVLLIHAC